MTPSIYYGENQCANPIYIKDLRMYVNCGKCEYCHKLWVNDWATRLMIQKQLSAYTICMTLTYNQDNLPISDSGVPTLSKSDVQKFFKRVRKQLSKNYPDVSIQYFISGEYGASFLRPHYHLILFINTFNYSYTAYDFENICFQKWQKGYIQFMRGENFSIRYLAKYIGKTTGVSDYADKHGIPKPFVHMSRRPAIASKYLELRDVFKWHFISLDNNKILLNGMGNYLIPRYVRKKVYEHWPKNIKFKYYQKLEDDKIYEYERKWLENCRKRAKNRSKSVLCDLVYFPTESETRAREFQQQRLEEIRLHSRQLEDINYIKNYSK